MDLFRGCKLDAYKAKQSQQSDIEMIAVSFAEWMNAISLSDPSSEAKQHSLFVLYSACQTTILPQVISEKSRATK